MNDQVRRRRFSLLAQVALVGVVVAVAVPMAVMIHDEFGSGTKVEPSQHRWHVFVYNVTQDRECGGSLINEGWVLTAAHCVRGTDQVTVLAGTHDKTDTVNGQKFFLTRSDVRPHPLHWNDPQGLRNDIALLRLNAPLTVAFESVGLPEAGGNEDSGFIAGWACGPTRTFRTLGRIASFSTCPSWLRYTQVDVVSQAQCLAAYGSSAGKELCAGGAAAGVDPMDSGGGLTTTQEGPAELMGIASRRKQDKPDAYTNVLLYKPWIEACVADLQSQCCVQPSSCPI